jgi:type VI secretion system protein ImpJ
MMSWNNKIVWSEGMFLKAQHFQQQDRYFERLVRQRLEGVRSYSWGIRSIQINQSLLGIGKFALSNCSGIFEDGTPFVISEDLSPPSPLDLPIALTDSIIYLCLPIQQPQTPEVEISESVFVSSTRYIASTEDAVDNINGSNGIANIRTAKLRLKYMLESEDRAGYHCLGLIRIREVGADKRAIIEPGYIPPVLSSLQSPELQDFINEILAMLRHRADALAQRVSGSGNQGLAEISDFLLLQVINKTEPVIKHLSKLPYLHPEYLYQCLVQLAGELSTFTTAGKRPDEFKTYQHDDLEPVFASVMLSIRRSLSAVVEQAAIQIPLQQRKYGIFVGEIFDKTLLINSAFILIVKAALREDDIRRSIPSLIKIGSVEQIRSLVNVQLPGVVVRPLAAAPRQLPFYAGGVYFELDTTSPAWKDLNNAGGIALHLSGEYPELIMELWAIRQR